MPNELRSRMGRISFITQTFLSAAIETVSLRLRFVTEESGKRRTMAISLVFGISLDIFVRFRNCAKGLVDCGEFREKSCARLYLLICFGCRVCEMELRGGAIG